MGALRAAELDEFGMIGKGAVYQAFRDGVLEDDDEVAVVHADSTQDYAVLSEAMVNLRHGLALALGGGAITPQSHDKLIAHAKAQPYPERSWAMIDDDGLLEAAEREALAAFLAREKPDLKRADALALLDYVAPLARTLPDPFVPRFEFEATVFWDQLIAAVRMSPEMRSGVPIEAIRAHVGAIEDHAPAMFDGALLLYLCVKEAQRSRVDVSDGQIESATTRFRIRHDIVTPEKLTAWLGEQRMNDTEFAGLMRVEALVQAVAKHHSPGLDAFLPAQLKRQGRYGDIARAIDLKRTALEGFGLSYPSAEDIGSTTDDLLQWYEEHFRLLLPDLDSHLEARRFVEHTRFVRELIAEYLVAGQTARQAVSYA
jgi:hypothetical protein